MRIPGIPYVQGRNDYPDADGTKYGIAIHNTSNTATAEAEASYATRRTDGVSAHFYVDSDSIIQSLDTDARAGHAGSSEGNQNAVAVEITGVNAWSRQQWLDRVAWDQLGRVLAVVCRRYGIAVRRASVDEMRANPRVRAFYGHDDMRRAWGGTTHTDPGPGFPWDRLFAAITAAGTEEMDMATVDDLNNKLDQLLRRGADWHLQDQGDNPRADGLRYGWRQLSGQMTSVAATLASLAGRDLVDEQELAQLVLAGLREQPLEEAATTLRAVLGPDRAAQLGQLLSAS